MSEPQVILETIYRLAIIDLLKRVFASPLIFKFSWAITSAFDNNSLAVLK
ncbi:MAG: hypothetical protein F6K13_09920 [Okeania sp. SIO2B9]|nr:hypothetical protein [Okeania sp. SIO2B9]